MPETGQTTLYKNLIETEVTNKNRDGSYRLKVTLLEHKIYIAGWRLCPPKDDKDWALYEPSFYVGGRWIKGVEFDKRTDFWVALIEKCKEAVQLFNASSAQNPSDKDLTDEAIKQSLDEASVSLEIPAEFK